MADVDGFPAGAGADPERPGHVEVELPRVASGPWDEVTMLDPDALERLRQALASAVATE